MSDLRALRYPVAAEDRLPEGKPSAHDQKVFRKVGRLIAAGWKLLGSFYTGYGHYAIRLSMAKGGRAEEFFTDLPFGREL
jgi:hypothetical protein